MLNVFRRHLKKCKKGYAAAHREKERGDCSCPVHVEGRIGGEYIRRALNTSSMERARTQVVEAESRGVWDAPSRARDSSAIVRDAVEAYLSELKGKGLSSPTVSKHRTLLTRLAEYAAARDFHRCSDLTFPALVDFRKSWPYRSADVRRNATTRHLKFLAFALKMKWVSENLATGLDMPMEENIERFPFTPDEEARIYAAALKIPLDPQQPITNGELQTFCYLMRYSGMAIADAALLQKSELRGDEVRYYRKKTRRSPRRVFVVVPLPGWLVSRIKALPLHGPYFFCHGSTHLVSAVDVWHKRLRKLFKYAEVQDGESHRFRHTFATRLLEAGESLEDVSRWLGHASVKTTERYYSHWLESRIRKSSDKLRKRYESAGHPPGEEHGQE